MDKIEIQGDDNLLRRVQFLHPNFIKPDGTVASSSFRPKKDEDGLSVDVERLTTYEASIQDKSRFRLYAIKALFTEELGLTNVHEPQVSNYAHVVIKGKIKYLYN